MDRAEFFAADEQAGGVKGVVFVGRKVLVYRRDTKTRIYPLAIDLPGGGKEGNETPFETFQRETREEFGLEIQPEDVTMVYHYEPETVRSPETGVTFPMSDYFPIVQLPESREKDIRFGDEGLEYMLMDFDEYLQAHDAIPAFQQRAAIYAADQRKNLTERP